MSPPPEGFRTAVAEYAVEEFGSLTADEMDYVLSRVEARWGFLGMTWATIVKLRPRQSLRQEVGVYVRNARKASA